MVLELTESIEWEFFNKGKANALFKYVGQEDHFKGKLLRLRLSDQVITTKEVFKYIELEIRPKLPETIECELVKVVFIASGALNDGYGLIIPNLLNEGSEVLKERRYFKTYKNKNLFILELKPKWLSQGSLGCRNCAQHRQKFGHYPEFCSLDLLDESKLSSAVSMITEDSDTQEALENYFERKDNVLQRLKILQQTDQKISGLTNESEITDSLSTAMTFRDVTIFLKIEKGLVYNVVVTDTDPKSRSKWKHWVSTENKLIENGYYFNTKHN